MEERKEQEIAHFDRSAKHWRELNNSSADVEGVEIMMMQSYIHAYALLDKYIAGKHVLDFGCGVGMHLKSLLEKGASNITGIDLSEESLHIAKERCERIGASDKVLLIKMDCENLAFQDQSFDVVWDGGTFSSLDIDRALSEIARVLKPGGVLIGIETLGHNPLGNLKRWLNKIRGARTSWAADHIFKMRDFDKVRKYFVIVEVRFFHFFAMFAFPFRNLPGGKLAFKALDYFDTALLRIPFINKYAFKTVFVFRKK